jgi:hypothetical protein
MVEHVYTSHRHMGVIMTEEERHIRDMEVDTSGWTMPWAVRLDLENHYWIDLEYIIYDDMQGTATLEVNRQSDGYRAELHKPYRYDPERISARDKIFTKRYKKLLSFARPN